MTGKSPLSDQQWNSLLARAEAGESLQELAKEVGFTLDGISRGLINRFDFRKRTQKPPMSREQSDAIHKRVQRGESLGAIARELGMKNNANLYKLMMRRYGYKPESIRYRYVWAPTIKLDWAKDTDLAYLAGIIDGEGCIMHLTRGRSNPIWTVRVNMTDRPVIEWLHQFGGTLTPRPSKNPKRKDQWEWSMSRQLDVQGLLTAILPYLKVKSAKAGEALADLASGLLAQHCDWTPGEIAAGGLHQGCGTYQRSR